MSPIDITNFLIGCYIPHHDSNFYVCLARGKPFANLEEDIVYFKHKGEVIVHRDMNARIKLLQRDAQPLVATYPFGKEPNPFGKLLLQMCHSTTNGLCLWNGTDDFICSKHHGYSVVD